MKLKGKHIFLVWVQVLYIYGQVDRLKDRRSFGVSYKYGYKRLNSTSVVIDNPLPLFAERVVAESVSLFFSGCMRS